MTTDQTSIPANEQPGSKNPHAEDSAIGIKVFNELQDEILNTFPPYKNDDNAVMKGGFEIISFGEVEEKSFGGAKCYPQINFEVRDSSGELLSAGYTYVPDDKLFHLHEFIPELKDHKSGKLTLNGEKYRVIFDQLFKRIYICL